MKVAIVKPPIIGSEKRGVGFYIERLFAKINETGNVCAEMVDFSWNENFATGFDVIHYPYFDPFFLTLPVIKKQKRVVTVHDLTPLIFPEGFPRGIRGEVKWQIQKKLLHFCDAIITVSQASKKDIIDLTGFCPEKIFVTYEAADSVFKKITDKNILKKIKEKYRLSENFVLYVGDVNYNKNLPNLFKACQINNTSLVIVGKGVLDLTINDQNIKRLGFVPTEDLVGIYNLANVYVQPSIYEGFGLPVVEALACGTPVICCRNSSLPEIAGNAATYANVTDPNDLAEKILHIKKTGLEISQAKKFSWGKTARETVKVYENINSCSSS